MPESQVRALLGDGALLRLTTQTKISIPQLLAELKEVRQQGYATNDEENREGVYSAGAVIRDSDNRAIGAVSGGVPSSGLTRKERTRVIKLVVEAARNASRKLGARIEETGATPKRSSPNGRKLAGNGPAIGLDKRKTVDLSRSR
jgi:DNA-binding IclR family transcriptional regulator